MDNVYSSIAEWLTNSTNGTSDDYKIYKYGVQAGFEQLMFISTCLLFSILMKEFTTMALLLCLFYLVRSVLVKQNGNTSV